MGKKRGNESQKFKLLKGLALKIHELKPRKNNINHKINHNINHKKKTNKNPEKEILKGLGLEVDGHIPLGIKVLTLYTLILSAIYLFAAAVSPFAVFFGNLLPGLSGKAVNFGYVIALLVLSYGFSTRKEWVWKFALVWYVFAMADSIISGFSINAYFDLLLNLLAMFLLFAFLANAIMFWYVYKKRTYFLKHSHPKVSKEDRIFLTSIAVVVLLFFVVALLTTTKFMYDTSKGVRESVVQLKTAFPGEEVGICKAKDLPERDICYLTLSIIKKDVLYCKAITSDFYKLTCYRREFAKN